MDSTWNVIDENRRKLLLCKVYTDALAQANVVDQPPAAAFDLEDETGDNVDNLQAYRSVNASKETFISAANIENASV
jgi:hypothetical protein